VTPAALVAQAQAFLADDPDPDTRTELTALLAGADRGDPTATAELADAFDGRLEFGTAGLRGRLGPGTNRMNRAVVSRAAAGLAAYLRQRQDGCVVIGYDARHKSLAFAHDTAEIMQAAGLPALVMPGPLPTPVLAYAIRALGAVAGVMVTASHNPPQDNGYKVYLGDGTQIVPPADGQISACIDAVGPVARIPRSDAWSTLGPDVLEGYLTACADLALPGGPRAVQVAYTPMHGVGGGTVLEVLARAGFPAPRVVRAQFDPDPAFPTVAFPNPEEPGAMDLAIAEGLDLDADVVIANDPDADRCAVAVPTRSRGADLTPAYRMLRGDEVGALLGWWVAERARRSGRTLHGCFASSIVSSSLLAKMAAAFGLPHHETLTGFKWIGRIPDLTFGYEEALGYCVDRSHVADKDGVSASLLVVEMVATLRAEGRTVHDVLDELARTHGLHATDQLSVRVSDTAVITDAMARLRDRPPVVLGGLRVEQFEDLEQGSAQLPPTDGLRLRLEQGARVVVRPSGTEPKIKCYLEVVVPVGGDDVAAARTVAATRLAALRRDVAAAAGLAEPGQP
jgi:phosphomannomutase